MRRHSPSRMQKDAPLARMARGLPAGTQEVQSLRRRTNPDARQRQIRCFSLKVRGRGWPIVQGWPGIELQGSNVHEEQKTNWSLLESHPRAASSGPSPTQNRGPRPPAPCHVTPVTPPATRAGVPPNVRPAATNPSMDNQSICKYSISYTKSIRNCSLLALCGFHQPFHQS